LDSGEAENLKENTRDTDLTAEEAQGGLAPEQGLEDSGITDPEAGEDIETSDDDEAMSDTEIQKDIEAAEPNDTPDPEVEESIQSPETKDLSEDGALEELQESDSSDTVGEVDEASGDELSDDENEALFPDLLPKNMVEALLFSSSSPVKPAKLASAAGIDRKILTECIAELNEAYLAQSHSFQILEVAKGYQMTTRPEYFPVIQNLVKTKTYDKLTQASLETLAIIAYKQPIIRADVEAVRGVQSGQIIRNLLERRLIKVQGRDARLGHPLLYGTTQNFLEVFGLKSLKDLPTIEELKAF